MAVTAAGDAAADLKHVLLHPCGAESERLRLDGCQPWVPGCAGWNRTVVGANPCCCVRARVLMASAIEGCCDQVQLLTSASACLTAGLVVLSGLLLMKVDNAMQLGQ